MATVLERRPPVAGRSASGRSQRVTGPAVDRLVMLLIAVVGFSLGFKPVSDNSFLTHLATGRRILSSGIPHSDPYTFTSRGSSWVVQSWLASVVYGGLDRLGGARAIEVLTAVITVSLALLLWHLSARAEHLIGRLMLVLPALLIGSGQWTERPYMFGLLALAGVLALDQSEHDVRWAVPIMWLWMQTHGSFPLGVLALLCLALGQRLDGEAWHRTLSIAKWSMVGVALGLVNPFGPKLLIFPLSLLQRNDMLHHIVEWQSPSFTSWAERAFLVQVVIVVALLARKPSWRLAIPAMVFVPMAMISSRNLVVASVVLIAAAAPSARGLGTIDGKQRLATGRIMVVLMLAFAAVIAVSGINRSAGSYEAYPTSALGWLSQQGALSGSARVVAPDVVGNFLEAAYGGSVPAYIDDRVEVFSPAVFADQITLMNGTVNWREALERANPSVVVWPRPLPLTAILLESPHWRSVYADPDWVVFERR